METDIWTITDSKNARKQGWDLVQVEGGKFSGKYVIQKIDEDAIFLNDDGVIDFVSDLAMTGDVLAQKALSLEFTEWKQ